MCQNILATTQLCFSKTVNKCVSIWCPSLGVLHLVSFITENTYFEIELLTRLDVNIGPAIGLTAPFASKFQYPGWKPNTIGYHSDDGKFYNESGQGTVRTPLLYLNLKFTYG